MKPLALNRAETGPLYNQHIRCSMEVAGSGYKLPEDGKCYWCNAKVVGGVVACGRKNDCPRCNGKGFVLLHSFGTARADYHRSLICCLCGGAGVKR